MPDPRETGRTAEIVQYLKQQEVLPYLTDPGTTEVHLHFHQAPQAPAVPADNRPVDQNPGQGVLERYAPYFVLGLFGCIVLAIVAVVVTMLAQTLLVVAGCAVALVMAVAYAGRSLTQDKSTRQKLEERKHAK
jgi:hypothetical protein